MHPSGGTVKSMGIDQNSFNLVAPLRGYNNASDIYHNDDYGAFREALGGLWEACGRLGLVICS